MKFRIKYPKYDVDTEFECGIDYISSYDDDYVITAAEEFIESFEYEHMKFPIGSGDENCKLYVQICDDKYSDRKMYKKWYKISIEGEMQVSYYVVVIDKVNDDEEL